MNKTLLLLALPTLMTACVEPERFDGEPMDGTGTEGAAAGDTGAPEDDMEDPDADTGGPAEETDGDETGGPGDETGGPGDETGGPEEPVCNPATHQCIDPVPAGWNGPIRAKDPSAEAGCGAGWDTEEDIVFDGAFAPESDCTCECGAPSGGTCETETDALEYGEFFGANEDGCETPTREFTLDESWTNPLGDSAMGWNVRWRVYPPDVASAGECSPDAETFSETDYPIQLAAEREVCGTVATDDACPEDGLCVPQGDARFESGVCVWQDGDVECPAGEFTERTVVHTEVEDTRECGECSCGTATGEACDDAEVRLWYEPWDREYFFNADWQCRHVQPQQGAVFSGEYLDTMHLLPGEPSGGSCPGLRDALGGVEAINPVTICCTAE